MDTVIVFTEVLIVVVCCVEVVLRDTDVDSLEVILVGIVEGSLEILVVETIIDYLEVTVILECCIDVLLGAMDVDLWK